MAETKCEETISWKEVALSIQQDFLYIFGESDWDSFEYSERDWLEKKVGHALHGPPQDLPNQDDNNKTGYNYKQLQDIQKVCAAIIKEDSHGQGENCETWMSMIFVCLEIPVKEGEMPCVVPVPVFRVPKYMNDKEETMSFLDSNARVYKHWEEFLKGNELPKCSYCYPQDGVYQTDDSGNVIVNYSKSPACKISKKVLTVLDHTSTAMAVGTTIISMASLFVPVAGPFLAVSVWGGATVGIYGAVRSTGALVDRKRHNQSVGVKDSEARNCWLSLVGNAIGAASAKAVNSVTKLAQAGQVLSKTGRMAVTALNVSSVAINGIGVVNSAFVLREKYKSDELTALDIFQFSSSVLFFAHAAVNMKTADDIIKDTQNNVFKEYEANLRSNKHRKMFRKIARNTCKDIGGIEGNAKIIKGLLHIEKPDDFFAGLVRVDKQIRKTQSNLILTETGFVEINQELAIHPLTLSNISKEQCHVILQATKNLTNGEWSKNQFKTVIEPTVQEQNVQFQSQRNYDASKILGTANSQKLQNSGQLALSNVNTHEKLDLLKEIMKRFDIVLHNSLLSLAITLSELMKWAYKLCDVLKFVCSVIIDIASQIESRYENDLKNAVRILGSNFCQEEFDENYKIQGKRFKHFCTIVLEMYVKNPSLIPYLVDAFQYGYNHFTSPDNALEIDSIMLQFTNQNQCLES